MVPPPPFRRISQDAVFYIPPWSRHLETSVLCDLHWERARGAWVFGDVEANRQCLEYIKTIRDAGYQPLISLEEYERKLYEWERRYKNFSILLSVYPTLYDRVNNKVLAAESTWRDIQADKPFMLYYYDEGESDWPLLKSIFEASPPSTPSKSHGNESQAEDEDT